jgi:Caspase domain/Sel1 repeat
MIKNSMKNILLLSLICALSYAQEKGFVPKKENNSLQTGKKLALVIGNKDYYKQEDKLKNPVNDANDMADALQKLGFKVIKKTDLNRIDFERAIDDFGHQLENYEMGLFYYSGHGLQAQGDNYLIPTDANIKYESEIKNQAVGLDRLFGTIEGAKSKINIIMLDACRNNFSAIKGFKGGGAGGFTNTDAPTGSIVVFATRTGKTADDNREERNGLFTGELLKYLTVQDLTFRQVLDKTTKAVKTKSNSMQEPVRFDGLDDDFALQKTLNTTHLDTESSMKSEIEQGKKAYMDNNYPLAFQLLNKHKDSQYFDAEAQMYIGYMFNTGSGVKQDYKTAVIWYKKAAEQENASGQFNLGRMYYNGSGVEQDYKTAIMWFKKASNLGISDAQLMLGNMYNLGQGVKISVNEVVKWYSLSAKNGNAMAQYYLGNMYEYGQGGLEINLNKAIELYQKSARQGNEYARIALKLLNKTW